MCDFISNHYSQNRRVRERKARGLYPVDEMNRFGILVCGFFCSICVSLTYAFDLFTTQFVDQFGLSAGDLSTVSTVGLVFCYFLLPYSLLFENFGPVMSFLICAMTGFIGCLCLALVFDGRITGNLATITVFYAFLNTASGLIDTTYISVLFEVFPRNRGPVVCLAKVLTGLGSSLLSCIAGTLFKGNITGFIYFLMAMIIVVCCIACLVIVLPPYFLNYWRRRGKSEEEIAELEATAPYYEHKCVPYRRLAVGYVVVICMIIFFAVQSPVLTYLKDVSRGAEIAVGVIAVVLTLCIFFMLLPLRCLGGIDEPAPSMEEAAAIEGRAVPLLRSDEATEAKQLCAEGERYSDSEANVVEPTNENGAALADNVATEGTVVVPKETRQDPRYTFSSLRGYLLCLDLWLLLLYMVCVGPIGILVSYNSSTVYVATTGRVRSTEMSALFTCFLGIGSSLGRIVFGLFEAYVQHQKPGNRKVLVTLALPFAPIVATVGGILIQFMPGDSILLPYILVYFTNGYYAALTALIFACMFDRFHNTLYNMGFLVTVFNVIIFNRALFGTFIDKKHDSLGFAPGQECTEKECVRVPFIVVTCLGALGVVVAAWVHVRYSRFVARVRAQREAELLAVGERKETSEPVSEE